jgi:hypothetical protein
MKSHFARVMIDSVVFFARALPLSNSYVFIVMDRNPKAEGKDIVFRKPTTINVENITHRSGNTINMIEHYQYDRKMLLENLQNANRWILKCGLPLFQRYIFTFNDICFGSLWFSAMPTAPASRRIYSIQDIAEVVMPVPASTLGHNPRLHVDVCKTGDGIDAPNVTVHEVEQNGAVNRSHGGFADGDDFADVCTGIETLFIERTHFSSLSATWTASARSFMANGL